MVKVNQVMVKAKAKVMADPVVSLLIGSMVLKVKIFKIWAY
jgi:ribosomal 50S subunit-recycling heat shock protein